jgi:cell fate (sporulation/competence/biofilm development) regulator YmcA (YheA/YmcA/DUF963 family)
MKTIKEKILYIKFAKSLGMPIDPSLQEEVDRYQQLQKEAIESVRASSESDLNLQVKQNEPAAAPVVEQVATKQKKVKTLVEKAAHEISKQVQEAESFQQPNPPAVEPNVDAIVKKIKFLEQAIGKIAVTGPGSGSGDVVDLTHRVVSVTSNSYTMGRKDYYVGVNYAGPVSIYLPSNAVQGRKVVVKDESGNCANGVNRWITIRGSNNDLIDGKNAANLAINYGSLTFVNKNGWRII